MTYRQGSCAEKIPCCHGNENVEISTQKPQKFRQKGLGLGLGLGIKNPGRARITALALT